MLFRLLLLAALLATRSASAHDFWIAADRDRAKPDAPVPVRAMVGHLEEIEAWNLRWERLVSFRSYGPTRVVDQQPGVFLSQSQSFPGGSVVRLAEPGTHVVALESHHAFSELPAEKFNDYLALSGLTTAQAARERSETSDQPGRELYSRRAKALIQVGEPLTDNVLRPIGQSLEITPLAHPYAKRKSETLDFEVRFLGQLLPGALVTAHRLDAEQAAVQSQRSDAQGQVRFTIPPVGHWKLHVTWALPITGHERAEFDTTFSSLTFGYRPGP